MQAAIHFLHHRDNTIGVFADPLARVPPLVTAGKQFVVAGFAVTHVRRHCEPHSLLVQILRGGRTSDAAAVLRARMRRDSFAAIGRTARKELVNACGKRRHECRVQPGAPLRLPIPTPRPRLGVGQALGFSPLERLILDEQALALVPLARATPPQDDGGKRGVFAGPARERRVAGREQR